MWAPGRRTRRPMLRVCASLYKVASATPAARARSGQIRPCAALRYISGCSDRPGYRVHAVIALPTASRVSGRIRRCPSAFAVLNAMLRAAGSNCARDRHQLTDETHSLLRPSDPSEICSAFSCLLGCDRSGSGPLLSCYFARSPTCPGRIALRSIRAIRATDASRARIARRASFSSGASSARARSTSRPRIVCSSLRPGRRCRRCARRSCTRTSDRRPRRRPQATARRRPRSPRRPTRRPRSRRPHPTPRAPARAPTRLRMGTAQRRCVRFGGVRSLTAQLLGRRNTIGSPPDDFDGFENSPLDSVRRSDCALRLTSQSRVRRRPVPVSCAVCDVEDTPGT